MTLPHLYLLPILPELIIIGLALLLLIMDMVTRFSDFSAKNSLMAGVT